MAKRPSVEDRLDRLAALSRESDARTVRRELVRAFGDRSWLVVAKAAKLVGELGESELVDEMVEAFDRFMVDPVKNDKGCIAKIAIARALLDLEESARELFLAGSRHIQLEPSFGPPVDTAAELRGICGHGLVASSHPQAVSELVRLLVDKEWRVRAEAARAFSGCSRLEAEPVLRLKALMGDDEAEVVGECFGALLSLGRASSLAFVADFLEPRREAVAQAAALALGESRLERAVGILIRAYEDCADPDIQRTELLSLAMTRREPALDFLLGQVAEAEIPRAARALAALAIHRHDERLAKRAEAVVRERDNARLTKVFEHEF